MLNATDTHTLEQGHQLVEASKKGDILQLQQLLSIPGLNVDHRARGEDATALGYAAFFGHLRCCTLLMDAGADVLAVDDTYLTPLHASLIRNHPDVTTLLMQPTVLARGDDNTTVLHWMAAVGCTVEHTQAVLKRADPGCAAVKDEEGRQAWEWAAEESGGDSEVAVLLREAADDGATAGATETKTETNAVLLSVYLRPSKEFVQQHSMLLPCEQYNADFDGLHCTLCSFAATNQLYLQTLSTLCDDLLENTILQKHKQNSPFLFNAFYEAPLSFTQVNDDLYILIFREAALFSDIISKYNLMGGRKEKQLHLSLGTKDEKYANDICDILNQCDQWELVIVEKNSTDTATCTVKVVETRLL